jgi:hypothetical protein
LVPVNAGHDPLEPPANPPGRPGSSDISSGVIDHTVSGRYHGKDFARDGDYHKAGCVRDHTNGGDALSGTEWFAL